MKEKNLLPLNIQMFAENEDVVDNGGGSEETPKTYSQEEYDKIIAERDKFKKSIDNLTKENADFKRKQKEKMSEEEKIAEDQKEKDRVLQETQKELLGLKLSKEFMIAGFSEETTSLLIESFTNNDSVEFVKTLSKEIKNLVENARKQEQESFKQNGALPPSGNQTSGMNSMVEKIIKERNSSNSNKAREYYLGKK